MKLSLVLTVNNRPPDVSRQVAESLWLPGNRPDELVVVLDRAPQDTMRAAIKEYERCADSVVFTTIEGAPGWLGPARAWNRGFAVATGDLFYCISSEVVQEAGNVERARHLAADGNTVVFGACRNSVPRDLVVGAEPGLLVSSRMPRPLGFIVCMPAAKVREIGGFDEAFMGSPEHPGYWFDDDDFFLRLWRTGVRFMFDDSIRGIHLDHERPDLATPAGQEGIRRNAALMVRKHGTQHPWPGLQKRVWGRTGQLVWEHVETAGA